MIIRIEWKNEVRNEENSIVYSDKFVQGMAMGLNFIIKDSMQGQQLRIVIDESGVPLDDLVRSLPYNKRYRVEGLTVLNLTVTRRLLQVFPEDDLQSKWILLDKSIKDPFLLDEDYVNALTEVEGLLFEMIVVEGLQPVIATTEEGLPLLDLIDSEEIPIAIEVFGFSIGTILYIP